MQAVISPNSALLADYSTNVCHTCPLTFNDSYNPFKVERKFEFILENTRRRLAWPVSEERLLTVHVLL